MAARGAQVAVKNCKSPTRQCRRYLPNAATIDCLVGALMLEASDEWAVSRRYMSLETLGRIDDTDPVRLPAVEKYQLGPLRVPVLLHHALELDPCEG